LIAMRDAADAERKAARAKAMLARIDTDADGFVSVAEMEAMPMMSQMFDRVDDNSDGAISKDEMDAMQARMAEHRGHGRGHGMGHGKGGGGFWGWMSDDN
jgi:Ca2+-binding EF-hand superfamily protein